MRCKNCNNSFCVKLNVEFFDIQILCKCKAILKAPKFSSQGMGDLYASRETSNPWTHRISDKVASAGSNRFTLTKPSVSSFEKPKWGGLQLVWILSWKGIFSLICKEKSSVVREWILFKISLVMKGLFSITRLFLVVQMVQMDMRKATFQGMLGWDWVVREGVDIFLIQSKTQGYRKSWCKGRLPRLVQMGWTI